MNRISRFHFSIPFALMAVALVATLNWLTPVAGAVQGSGVGQGASERSPKVESNRRGRPTEKLLKKDKAIRGEYIVVLDDEIVGPPGEASPAETLAAALARTYGAKLKRTFKHAINGFSATMTEAQATAMSADTLVAYIQEDSEVSPAAVQSPVGSWGMDRVDQRPRTRDNRYSYLYAGSGVTVYVVDSGITTSHTEFGGRAYAMAGWDFVGDGWNGQDCNGHGTHVAGTIGGRTVGIAKQARLVSVRVLGCNGLTPTGTNSNVIAAVDAITGYAQKPAVVNMSIDGGYDYLLNTAIARSMAARITYVVAAGNNGIDACQRSPASSPAIAVGATDWNDQRAVESNWSSNWGACVDVWAPGRLITSAAHTSTTALRNDGGTSMASPHVAGAAAIYLSAYPGATPDNVRSIILNTATTNLLTGIGTSSSNRLLFSPLQY